MLKKIFTERWIEGWQGGREQGGDLISEVIMFPCWKRQWSWQFYCSIVSYGFWIKNKLASFKEDNPESLGDQWWVMHDCPWPPSSQRKLCLQLGGLRAQQGWEWPPHSQSPRGGKLQADRPSLLCLSLSASVSLCLLLANNCSEGRTSGEFMALLSAW